MNWACMVLRGHVSIFLVMAGRRRVDDVSCLCHLGLSLRLVVVTAAAVVVLLNCHVTVGIDSQVSVLSSTVGELLISEHRWLSWGSMGGIVRHLNVGVHRPSRSWGNSWCGSRLRGRCRSGGRSRSRSRSRCRGWCWRGFILNLRCGLESWGWNLSLWLGCGCRLRRLSLFSKGVGDKCLLCNNVILHLALSMIGVLGEVPVT